MTTREEVLRRHIWSWHPECEHWSSDSCDHWVKNSGVTRQCRLSPSESISGYAFCTQHAKMVQGDLEKADESKA